MIINGNPVSSGLALGKVFLYRPFSYLAKEEYFEEGEQEKYLDLFCRAAKAAGDELDGLLDSFADKNENRAEIIKAHKEILCDEEIIQMIQEAILDDRKMPCFAVCQAFDEFIGILSKARDPLIAGRVSDLKDVRDRILRILLGKTEQDLSNLPGKVILVTQDLLPSATANLDRENVLAIVTEAGGTTSHSAIIARSSGIPAVSGVEGVEEIFSDGEEIAVDAVEGTIYAEMTAEETESFKEKIRLYEKKAAKTAAFLRADSVMADGTRMEIGVNISSDGYIEGYRHCDYVGLFRTEFLYMENDHLPTEEEQLSAYRKVLAHAGGKPVTIRTLDIGGDKNLDYLELPKEQNPFLGKRALRFCMDRADIFKTQLRAILRASAHGQIWLMFPMVGSLDDFYNAKKILSEAMAELDGEKLAYDPEIKTGVMIEIPSAGLIADLIAREADFASIGTNDLCQYLTAVDRMNAEISRYYQSMGPAMIRMLKMIADGFIKAGKPLSVCGELGGDPRMAVVFAGLGIRKLSMSYSCFAGVKEALSRVTAEEAEEIAGNLLHMRTQTEIEQYLKEKIR